MASFIRRITREFPSKLAAIEEARMAIPDTQARTFIENRLKVPVHRFTDVNSYLDTSCKKVWATFRACSLFSSIIQSTEFRLTKEGVEGDMKVPGLTELLASPNPLDSWVELMNMWTFHIKITGGAFWYKDQMNSAGRPVAIYPLLPQYIKIIPDQEKNISGYIYSINGREIKYEADEIIYFRRPHPKSLLFGLGDIEPSQDLYQDFINRNTYQEKFLENGAQPSGVMALKTENPSEEDFGKVKAMFQKEYSGKTNAGKTMFLTGEWAYHKLGLDQTQMQAIEREKFSIEQIFMNHGVPLSIAGLRDAANYATARVEEMNFRKYEIVPLLDLFCSRLNMQGGLVQAFNPAVELDYNLSGLLDVEQVCKDYLPLVREGAMTRNEMREKAGLPRVDDRPELDLYFLPRTYQPIEMAGLVEIQSDDPELEDIVEKTRIR